MILASSSPRRIAILQSLGVIFRVVPPKFDEMSAKSAAPELTAEIFARAKVASVAKDAFADELAIAADTVIVFDGKIFGKPRDESEAAAMLAAFSGKTPVVHTGLAVFDAKTGEIESKTVAARIEFRALSSDEIAAYVATGEWRDAAGGFRVQEKGSRLVNRIEGSVSAVVGLPIFALAKMLQKHGFEI